MKRMKAMMKKDKSGQPPAYLKRNRASEKMRRKSKQRVYDQEEKVRADAKSHMRQNKEMRDRVRDANVKGKYTNKMAGERIEYQRPRRKEVAQYSQTDEIDFGDDLDAYYTKRESPSYDAYYRKREKPSYDKETETEDYHDMRYRRSLDDPYESDTGGRRYYKKDRAAYETGTGMEEYERDERGYRGHGGWPHYQSEPDLSGSDVSSTDYKRRVRGSSESRDSTEYKHEYRERRRKRPEYEDMSYSRLLPYDHNVYRYEEGKKGARRPKEADYTYDSDSGSETSGGKSKSDFEVTSDATEYTTEYTPEEIRSAAKSDRHRRRDDRAYLDAYERKVKRDRKPVGFHQQQQVFVTHPVKQRIAFEPQRSREHRGARELRSMSSQTVFLPVTEINGSGKSEMDSEEVIEQAEKPLEQNVHVYAATDLEQGNAFKNAAKGVENSQTGGSLSLNQSINANSKQEKENNSKKISGFISNQGKCKGSDVTTVTEVQSRKTKESQEEPNTHQKISPGTDSNQRKSNRSVPPTTVETQNRKTKESISPFGQPIIAHVSQEEGKDFEQLITSSSDATQQKSGGHDTYVSVKNQYRQTKENISPSTQPISLSISQEDGKTSQRNTTSAPLGSRQQHRESYHYEATKDHQLSKPYESFISNPVNAYTSQEEWNTIRKAMSSGQFSTQQRIDENEPSNPVRKSIIHIPSILKNRSIASRKSVLGKQSSYILDNEGSIEDVNAHEAEGRESENTKRKSTRISKKNETAGDAQNSADRKSVLQKPLSTENPKKSHTLVRQISGSEENIYSSKKPNKTPALSRQMSGTEENIHSSKTNLSGGTKGARKSNMMTQGTDRKGSIKKNTPPQHLPGATRNSETKDRDSVGNVARKQSMVKRLFQRKKKSHSDEVSSGESEEHNKSGNIKKTSISAPIPKATDSYIDDETDEPFHIYGYAVPYITNLFLATKIFLGLNSHDSMINVLNNGDD